MTFSGDPSSVADFRYRTKTQKPSGIPYTHHCSRCGRVRSIHTLVRKLGTSRHNPTSWHCRDGCEGEA